MNRASPGAKTGRAPAYKRATEGFASFSYNHIPINHTMYKERERERERIEKGNPPLYHYISQIALEGGLPASSSRSPSIHTRGRRGRGAQAPRDPGASQGGTWHIHARAWRQCIYIYTAADDDCVQRRTEEYGRRQRGCVAPSHRHHTHVSPAQAREKLHSQRDSLSRARRPSVRRAILASEPLALFPIGLFTKPQLLIAD